MIQLMENEKIKTKSFCRTAVICFALAAAFFPTFASQEQGMVLGASTSTPSTTDEPRGADAATTKIFQDSYAGALSTSAREVSVYDVGSGQVLVSQNAGEEVPIASLTKLMTALVVYQSKNFDVPIEVTAQDRVDVAPALHLKVGDEVMPKDLVEAMLVGSANDAAQTLANHFPDQATFLSEMNAQAASLGMDHTHYTTPIGFDVPGNYSTASDLAKLVSAALKILPYSQVWHESDFSFTSVDGNTYSVKNSNALVGRNPNILSIKTGLTPEAGGSMIVEAKGSSGQSIVAIVLGSSDRDADTLAVVGYTFRSFEWQADPKQT